LRTASGEELCAPKLLLCTGAWTEHLAEPRKGQMLCVRMPAGAPALRDVIRTPELYLVPRGDGRIVVGATVERAGFSRELRPEATEALLRAGAALWPPLALGEVTEAWTGLRPGTVDDLPVLGRLRTNTWVACGHFRNGILLAPATARLAREWTLGEPHSIDLSPFAPDRFVAGRASTARAS
jgi:glycine oxidase